MQPTLRSAGAASHLPRWHPLYYLKVTNNLTFFLRALSAIQSVAATVDLAHVHVSSYGSTFRKYFISKKLVENNIPFILHNHGGRYARFYSRLPEMLKRRIIQMFRWAKGAIVLSQQSHQFHRQIVGDPGYPIWIVPNPIERPSVLSLPPPPPPLRLLFLGRLDSNKGADRALQALALLPADVRSQVRLYMAGDGAVEAMQDLARQLGISEQVEIRSWIEGDEKERWLRESHVFTLPSRAEGLPMAMLEAMAYGKAVIASSVGGIPEWLTEGQEGFLVSPDDIPALSEAIQRLVEAPELCRQMGLRAHQRVEPLSVENYCQQLRDIYEQVLVGTSR